MRVHPTTVLRVTARPGRRYAERVSPGPREHGDVRVPGKQR